MTRTSTAAAAAAAAALLLSGCIRYYKTADVRSRLASNRKQLDRAIARVDVDLRRKQSVCRRRGVAGCGELLGRMQRSRAEMRRCRADFVKIQREFESLARGTRRIRSDSPRWEPLQVLRARAEQLGEQIDAAGQQYKAATDELASRLRVR